MQSVSIGRLLAKRWPIGADINPADAALNAQAEAAETAQRPEPFYYICINLDASNVVSSNTLSS
jgi:hypothetical protein